MSLAVEAVEINGVVITGRGPASSGEVMLYDRLPQEDTEVVYRVSLKNGFYVLNVPEGEYYIMARAVRDEEHYTGYYGGNPLYVSGDEEIWLPLMAVRDDLPETVPSETTELRGRVLFKDSPVTNAEVSLYLAGSGALRGLGYLTVTTDSEGWFRMNPIGGEYYLIARKRRSGGGIRPLRRGDLYCYYTGNPVTVPEDAAMTVTIRCYPKEDITGFIDGDIRDTVMVKRLKASSTRMRERKPLPEPDMATLKGRVVSSEGPVEGVRVLAYEREDGRAFQMNMIRTMPSFMTVTTSDGRFNLPLSKGREYFLVARQYLGVWPLRGELYGMYEGNVDHFITAGRNSNVTIRVSGVMTPAPGGREPGQGTLISNAWYSDTVIREDTVWKGTITIEGTVVVARGVTLTVLSGTVVRFRKVDRDGDGTGDGKLRVLGNLVVQGLPERKVLFTSAEVTPAPGDWAYVLLFTGSDRSEIRHAVFEYAFTGLQIHFAEAVVTDSIFRNSVEGIRFGSASGVIEQSSFYRNRYGIRFTRIASDMLIRKNEIRDNEVGIFHVPSGQNTVDFDPSAYHGYRFGDGMVRVVMNNIESNLRYNYMMGERQSEDHQAERNWWGSSDVDAIERGVFDRVDEPGLGRLLYRPFLESRLKEAGPRKGGHSE
jgi:hypothetical protein